MAVVKPFRAFRYNPDAIGSIALAAAPLLEVLSEPQVQALESINYNAIHVTRPTQAYSLGHLLNDWRARRILAQDDLPAFYPYYQHYSLYRAHHQYVQRGLVALVRLNHASPEPEIIVHEDTLKHTLAQRLEILKESQMNVTPVHGLYHDSRFELERILDKHIRYPVLDFVDQQGVRNQLGVLQHRPVMEQVQRFFQDKTIYLADGHHRLETSEMYLQALNEREGLRERRANYILMYLSNYASNSIRILPTHRLFRLPINFDRVSFWQAIERYFITEPFNKRAPLFEELQERPHSIGVLLAGESRILTLRPEVDLAHDMDLPLPLSVKRLDYTVLHYFIFDRILGLPYAEQRHSDLIRYSKDYTSLVRQVQEDPAWMAVIVNNVRMEEILDVCADGARMPQKSTYFYPKMVSGLVFASINDEDYRTPFDSGF